MVTLLDWPEIPNEFHFKPRYQGSDPQFGAQNHTTGPAFWFIEMNFPQVGHDRYFELEALLADGQGVGILNVSDPRRPYPRNWIGTAGKDKPASVVPDLIVQAAVDLGRNSTLTVLGEEGDYITVGDPIAFTRDGRRHYYRAKENLRLTGAPQALKIYLSPRFGFTGENITAERIRPTLRFQIQTNDVLDLTTSKLTPVGLIGVEYWHEIL